MGQASELAIAVAVAVVLIALGSFLIFTAPLSADFQCRLLGSPQGGRYWRFTLALMRVAGVFVWLLAVAFVLMAFRQALPGRTDMPNKRIERMAEGRLT